MRDVNNGRALLDKLSAEWGIEKVEPERAPTAPPPPKMSAILGTETKSAATSTAPRDSSWSPASIQQVLNDDYSPLEPSILRRTDGLHLFYAGLTHDLHGESESGKSWLAQCAVSEVLKSGERALYLDFESDARSVALRLRSLGVPVEVLADASQFAYIRPDTAPLAEVDKAAFEGIFSGNWKVAIIDGVTNAMTLLGLDGINNRDVSKFHAMLTEHLAIRTGAAVIQVDHVPKSSEARRGSIGSVHKLNAITGASYLVSVKQPLAPGSVGVIEVRVSKDRPGAIRARSGPVRKGDQTQLASLVHADGTGQNITFTLNPPDQSLGTDSNWRPTALMEAISRSLEEQNEAVSQRTIRTSVKGKAETQATALEFLLKEGYISESPGPRGAKLYRSLKAFRSTPEG